jgi:diguanylate cyclase (GGDEF)-like protein/PAS domain S-box-containing protein
MEEKSKSSLETMDSFEEETKNPLFEFTNDAIIIVGLDLCMKAVNRRAADLLGYAVKEMIGMDVQEIISPEEWSKTLEVANNIGVGEHIPFYERTFIAQDGAEVIGEVETFLIPDQKGEPKHYQVLIRDVTRRKEAEEALKRSEMRFRRLAENIGDGVVIVEGGKMIFCNDRLSEITGYSKEELAHIKGINMAVEEELERVHLEYSNALAAGRPNFDIEYWIERKDGERKYISNHYSVRYVRGEWVDLYISISDITDKKIAVDHFKHLATHDPLTKIPNRALFQDRLEHALTLSNRHGSHVAVMMVDMDGFKIVNDTLGHENGDLALKEVAKRFMSTIRESDTVARVGGDEFAFVIERPKGLKGIDLVVERIIQSLETPIVINDHEFVFTVSVGISLCPDHSATPKELVLYADTAMYTVKSAGKNGYRYFEPEMLTQK